MSTGMAHFLVLSGSSGGLDLASTPFTEAAAGGPVSWGDGGEQRGLGARGTGADQVMNLNIM